MPASDVLPSPGGPAKSRWSAGWSRLTRRLDDDPQVLGELALADELGERARSQPDLVGLLGRCGLGIDRAGGLALDPGVHGAGPSTSLRASGVTAGAPARAGHARTSSSTGASPSTASRAPAISSGA